MSKHLLIILFPLAGAIIAGGKGTAETKIAALQDAGVRVESSPATVGKAMYELFQERGMV